VLFRNSLGTSPGDSFENATPLRSGEYGPFELSDGDRHYFRVDLQEGEQLAVTLSFAHADGDLDLRVHGPADGEEPPPELGAAESTSDDESFRVTARRAGAYYVVPYGFSGEGNEYSLSVEVTEQTTPGGSVETARLVTAGTYGPYRIAGGEEQYFAVGVEEGDRLQAGISFEHKEADLDLVVQGPNGTEAGGSASTTDDETVSVRAGTTGSYTIRVFPFDDGSTRYELSVSTQ